MIPDGLEIRLRRTEGVDAIGDRRIFEVVRVISECELRNLRDPEWVVIQEYREARRLLNAEMDAQHAEVER